MNSRNKTAYGLGVFAYLLIAVWLLFFVAGCGLLASQGYAAAHIGNVGKSFAFDGAKLGPVIFTIVLAVLLVAALVLTIVRTAKSKRLILIPATLALILAGFAVIELFANMTKNQAELGYLYMVIESGSSKKALYTLALFAVVALTFLVTLVYWLSALAATSKKLAAMDAEQEGGRRPCSEEERAEREKHLEDLVRRIVLEELEKRPEVIQNFYGVAGLKEPVESKTVKQEVKEPIEEPEPEPVKEEPKQEEGPVPFVKQEKEPEPEPEPVVIDEEEDPKKQIIRIPFDERLVAAEKDLKENYNELKNDILAYGVKSRISNSGDTFRLHRKAFVKITIAGKGLKLYFALNPANYAESTIPVIDASDKAIYEETPCAFKVKSALSVRRAKQLIADVMATEGLEQAEPRKTDWVKQVRADLKAEKAEKAEQK